MILRLLLVLFISGASAICYLAGYTRLMSGLLIFFGALAALFFGLLFTVPSSVSDLWFPVYGQGSGWPFYVLAMLLCCMAFMITFSKDRPVVAEALTSFHLQYFVGAVLALLFFIFLASYFWFPSDERRLQTDPATLEGYVFLGTAIFLVGEIISLFLFYWAARGGIVQNADLMRRLVPAFFSFFHLDKIPAFIAFLLVYSPETQIIYAGAAALALAGYLPIAVFFFLLSRQSRTLVEDA